MISSLYRQEMQVRAVKSWLKHKQLVGSLFPGRSSAYELILCEPSSPLGPRADPGQRGVRGKATEPHLCQPFILATHTHSWRSESFHFTDEEMRP